MTDASASTIWRWLHEDAIKPRQTRRVFWVVDNGSSHCGRASAQRMADAYPTARLIHLPVHASWLNQIELYFGSFNPVLIRTYEQLY